MVGVDEAGHDDAAARVDLGGAARVQVRPDGEDFLALDEHVGLGKIAHVRVHRHHGTAANDIAPATPAGVLGHVPVVRRAGARREQIGTCGGDPGRGRRLQEIAPRTGMDLRNSFIAQFAHWFLLRVVIPSEQRKQQEARLSEGAARVTLQRVALAIRRPHVQRAQLAGQGDFWYRRRPHGIVWSRDAPAIHPRRIRRLDTSHHPGSCLVGWSRVGRRGGR